MKDITEMMSVIIDGMKRDGINFNISDILSDIDKEELILELEMIRRNNQLKFQKTGYRSCKPPQVKKGSDISKRRRLTSKLTLKMRTKTEIENQIESEITEIENKIENKIESEITEIENKIESEITEIENKIENKIETEITEIKNKMENKIESEISEIENKIESEITEIENKMENEIKNKTVAGNKNNIEVSKRSEYIPTSIANSISGSMRSVVKMMRTVISYVITDSFIRNTSLKNKIQNIILINQSGKIEEIKGPPIII